ncbi:MAG TPA: UDP-glucose 4-epimerase GalE [Kofleriaceae bacterium]|jgi:UDP-glucose-4-epimerase GalE|nr:UDP-glucose 4-epimerase GalE [Kofleriaceae bacterium]
MIPRTILVTGGAGFIGSHFAYAAIEAGRSVVVLDNLSGGAPALLPPNTPLVVADIGDRQTVRQVCAAHHVGAVAHFAGKIQSGESVVRPDIYFEVNLVRSLALLDAIREEGITACLFSSSAAVYGRSEVVPLPELARREPINPYGATKLAFEFALEAWGNAYGLRWAALRYFNAAGAHPNGAVRENHEPETHLIPLAIDAAFGAHPPLTIYGDDYDTNDGTCIRDYIHVLDLAAAHLVALTCLEQGQTLGPINLGTGHGYSVREVIEATAQVLGRPVPHVIGERRAGDPARLVADPSRAMAVLSWRPHRSELSTIVSDAARSRTSSSAHPALAARMRHT